MEASLSSASVCWKTELEALLDRPQYFPRSVDFFRWWWPVGWLECLIACLQSTLTMTLKRNSNFENKRTLQFVLWVIESSAELF